MFDLDQELVFAFTSFNRSVDRIAAFQQTRNQFLDTLPQGIRSLYGDDALIWRLLQLRKSSRLPKHNPRS
jgi:hypothetical protein